MALSGEYRWLKRLPPLVGQLGVGAAVSFAPAKSCPPCLFCAWPDETSKTEIAPSAAKNDRRIVPLHLVRTSPHCFTRCIARETQRHSRRYKRASSRLAGASAGSVS